MTLLWPRLLGGIKDLAAAEGLLRIGNTVAATGIKAVSRKAPIETRIFSFLEPM